jgi:hypothetical protein
VAVTSHQITTGEITMKIHHLYIAAGAALLLAGTAHAGTMSCGDAFITDDQPQPLYKQEILEQCGEPTSREGNNWFYDRSDMGQGIYILHFNDAGQLASIEEQVSEE